ncbi:class I SAM-dependent methyltransferase [Alkalibacterium psychrotolerans]
MTDYFFELYDNLDQLGPGSKESTLKATSFVPMDEPLKILDVGCGRGRQTLYLADRFKESTIVAVDNHQPFLDSLNNKIKARGLEDRVTTVCASMDQLPFDEDSFDLIWSEGAIYIMGFENGLKDWRRYLKPGGIIACSEICWLSDSRPKALQKFWDESYDEMATVEEKLAVIKRSGFITLSHFLLPKADWSIHYYAPLEGNIEKMKQKYPNNPEAEAVIQESEFEIRLFENYADYYGYVFFLLQKN